MGHRFGPCGKGSHLFRYRLGLKVASILESERCLPPMTGPTAGEGGCIQAGHLGRAGGPRRGCGLLLSLELENSKALGQVVVSAVLYRIPREIVCKCFSRDSMSV